MYIPITKHHLRNARQKRQKSNSSEPQMTLRDNIFVCSMVWLNDYASIILCSAFLLMLTKPMRGPKLKPHLAFLPKQTPSYRRQQSVIHI